MRDNEIDIIALPETHSTSDTNLINRGEIPGYKLIGAIHSNVNKLPSVYWLNISLEKLPHPAIYVDDFNSHNQAWEYEHNDIDGNHLMEWMILYRIHLIYHPKDIGTFRSARWQKDYTPDFSMMTQESADEDITTTRHIISNFSRSQHRPVIIHYGMRIPLMNSMPKPRWKAFADDFDHVNQFIPARSNSYERFAKLPPNVTSPEVTVTNTFQVRIFDVMKNTTPPIGVKRLLI
jgi:hypothetical protein